MLFLRNFLLPPTRPAWAGLVRDAEAAERDFFWRIGERPILQKLQAFGINIPLRLKAFDLVASHHQIKNNSYSAIFAPLR